MAPTTQLYSGTQTFESGFLGERSIVTITGAVPKCWAIKTSTCLTSEKKLIGQLSSLKLRVRSISQRAAREYLIDAQRGNSFTLIAESVEISGFKEIVGGGELSDVDVCVSACEAASMAEGNAVFSQPIEFSQNLSGACVVPPNAVAYMIQYYPQYFAGGTASVQFQACYDGNDVTVSSRTMTQGDTQWIPLSSVTRLSVSASAGGANINPGAVLFLLAL